MGLADRFKAELKNQDLYYTTKGIQKPEVVEIPKMVTTPKELSQDKFSDLRKDLLKKIKNTPCWNDYSANNQENMIIKYFETKNKRNHLEFNSDDTAKFLKTILG